MDDVEGGKALERAWKKAELGSSPWPDVFRAARALLAKPVATREAIKEALRPMWLTQDPNSVRTLDMWASAAEYALTHFAPPRQRMMIEGMAVAELETRMMQEYGVNTGASRSVIQSCARVAHRLATTPAPEVDAAEEKAKDIAWKWAEATGVYCTYKDYEDPERRYWESQSSSMKNGWLAVAAMGEKGNG